MIQVRVSVLMSNHCPSAQDLALALIDAAENLDRGVVALLPGDTFPIHASGRVVASVQCFEVAAGSAARRSLTSDEFAAVVSFAKDRGRYWKADLRVAWETGIYRSYENAGVLQTIRNAFGPSWLVSFKLPKK